MDLRLIEIFIPEKYKKEVEEVLEGDHILDIWQETIEEDHAHVKILLPTGETEKVLDILEKRFSTVEGFRVILLPVEASIPRPKAEEEPKSESESWNLPRSQPQSSSGSAVKNYIQTSTKPSDFPGYL